MHSFSTIVLDRFVLCLRIIKLPQPWDDWQQLQKVQLKLKWSCSSDYLNVNWGIGHLNLGITDNTVLQALPITCCWLCLSKFQWVPAAPRRAVPRCAALCFESQKLETVSCTLYSSVDEIPRGFSVETEQHNCTSPTSLPPFSTLLLPSSVVSLFP